MTPQSNKANDIREGTVKFTDLRVNDVLVGRGVPYTQYEGNVKFRDLVKENAEEYASTSQQLVKDGLVRKIMSIVTKRDGRFLRKIEIDSIADPPAVMEEDGIWEHVEPKLVREKIKQAFRDFANREAKQEAKKKRQRLQLELQNQGGAHPPPGYNDPAGQVRAAALMPEMRSDPRLLGDGPPLPQHQGPVQQAGIPQDQFYHYLLLQQQQAQQQHQLQSLMMQQQMLQQPQALSSASSMNPPGLLGGGLIGNSNNLAMTQAAYQAQQAMQEQRLVERLRRDALLNHQATLGAGGPLVGAIHPQQSDLSDAAMLNLQTMQTHQGLQPGSTALLSLQRESKPPATDTRELLSGGGGPAVTGSSNPNASDSANGATKGSSDCEDDSPS